MARRGRKTAEEETVVTEPDFSFDSTEPVAATEETAAPEEQGPRLDEEYPKGTLVTLAKTDWKGQFGEVTGVEDKRNVLYLGVQLTHYANGKPRPEEKRQHVTVRPQSVQKVDSVPEYTEPVKEEASTSE
jgi:hypothetical protein